ncbi:hypothetical protein ACWDWO_16105 [Actinopolymorpha singaporensis]
MSNHDGRNVSRRGLLRATGAGVAAAALPDVLRSPVAAATPRMAGPVNTGAVASGTAWDTMSDTWAATDGLGRSLPTHEEVGGPRTDRFVGVFYFLWLGQHSTDGPYDISRILTANPAALHDGNDPAWGPMGHFHHWGEPYFGYYLSDDAWVIRKHAQMLADAGVDTVIFDVTNGFTYRGVYHVLLDTFAAVRAAGGATPRVAFLTPFGNPTTVVKDLYHDLYQPGTHQDLWFRWKGKPLILADPDRIGPDLATSDGTDPSRLAAGHPQGQTFTADEPFLAAGGRIPTWSTTDAAMTLTLYADGPGGAVLARQRFDNVADNALVTIRLDQAAPAGTYYLEQTDPSGSIGWWTDPGGSYTGGQAYLDGRPVPGDRSLYLELAARPVSEVKDFFTFRAPQPSYFVGPTGPDQWGWLEVAPQHVFRDDAGAAEQMTAGVAQNAVDGRLGAMSEPHAQGRSFHDGRLPTDDSRTPEGLNLQEQWDRVLAVDPEFVFVTGWNEWVAQRFDSFAGVEAPVVFVDQFDWEHSRDIEPLRGGADGGFPEGKHYQDAYYYQLVSNIRRYKGVRRLPRASAPRSIEIDGEFADWADVGPEFRDHIGDTAHRDHPGWGDAGRYVNTSGRNDIVCTKVARDSRALFFYARTAEPLTSPTDRNWMLLLIDVTGDPSSGWEGFDLLVNRRIRAGRASVEVSRGGWSWRQVARVPLAVAGHELELAIPRAVLGADPAKPLRIEFKWIDNMQADGDILDVLGNGDAAPSGRFRYRYWE